MATAVSAGQQGLPDWGHTGRMASAAIRARMEYMGGRETGERF